MKFFGEKSGQEPREHASAPVCATCQLGVGFVARVDEIIHVTHVDADPFPRIATGMERGSAMHEAGNTKGSSYRPSHATPGALSCVLIVIAGLTASADPPAHRGAFDSDGERYAARESSPSIIRQDLLDRIDAAYPNETVTAVIALRAVGSVTESPVIGSPRAGILTPPGDSTVPRIKRIEAIESRFGGVIADAADEIRRLGGVVRGFRPWGLVLVADLPAGSVAELAAHPDVLRIDGNTALEGRLEISSATIRADSFWGQGYTGSGCRLALVDTGVDATHPALSGVPILDGVFLDAAGLPIFDNGADDVNGHGTHLAGVLASDDVDETGVSYGASLLMNVKAAYDVDGLSGGITLADPADLMDGIDWAITHETTPADVVVLPYGTLALSGDSALARYIDAVVDSLDAVVVVPAGNLGPLGSTIEDPGIAHNALTVASLNPQGTADRSDDTVSLTGSRGPTLDGRRKPDLIAPGVGITSANHDHDVFLAPDWVEKSGTSVAAAHVAGAAALIHERLGRDALATKALLINSAEDLSTAGWDAATGWGAVDLDRAEASADYVYGGAIDPSPAHQLYVANLAADDHVTLAWNRHVLYAGGIDPVEYDEVANLDLYLYDEDDGSAVDSDTSVVDNVHRVVADESGPFVVRIESLTGSYAEPTQSFAIAADQALEALDVEALDVSLSSASIVAPEQTFVVRADLSNFVGAKLQDVWVTLELPDGTTLESGANPVSIGGLEADATQAAFWSVTAPDDWGDFDLDVSVDSASYGIDIESDATSTVLLGRGDSIGIYYPEAGSFFMRDTLVSGIADYTLRYGPFNAIPVTGDFDGDGRDSMGIYNTAAGVFFLRNDISRGNADVTVRFGPGGMTPLIGDWDGDGDDTIGLYDPVAGIFYLRDSNTAGVADHTFRFGPAGLEPLVGDWDGDGDDTIGLYNPTTGTFYLRNELAGGPAEFAFRYGPIGEIEPLAGDWDDDGVDTVGIYVPHIGVYFLRDAHGGGAADWTIRFGAKRRTPIVGDWDGK